MKKFRKKASSPTFFYSENNKYNDERKIYYSGNSCLGMFPYFIL